MESLSSSPAQVAVLSPARRGRWFFPVTAILIVALVAVAFAPSFYLRGLGTEGLPPSLRSLPAYIYAHGIALSLWFALFVTQVLLVASNRTEIHRRLGLAAVFVAAAVVVTTLVTLQHAIATPVRAPLIDVPIVFFFNLLGLVQFSVLVGCALWFRRHPETHKRLMFLANIPLLAAAVSRLPGALEVSPLVAANSPLLLLVVLIVRDIVVRRRLHRATVWGGIVLQLLPIPLTAAIGLSGLGKSIVQALA